MDKLAFTIFGALFSLFLVPMVEKKKAEFQCKKDLEMMFIELGDLQSELTCHIESYFKFLLKIRQEPELTNSLAIPIPLSRDINVDILIELYKNLALVLSRDQRLVVKRVPRNITLIMSHAQTAVSKLVDSDEYCIQSIKNTIKLSCKLVHELNSINEQRERYVDIYLDSQSAMEPVLKSMGFTEEQLNISTIRETHFV
ncbi:hypothetical protein [Pseudoalteromonas sp. SG44-17]|uniref:hypothetical protein n=1 Tax=Pseudoalteromonas sp. SG44-17 TaxID=2760963 RepID=UPI0016001486|nr:hypothetical protein [Pseudoalteromonas sp. SG44-17]MBB1411441.1 hypothetical protein [Pseudoalteromonas sp. SG44-17]